LTVCLRVFELFLANVIESLDGGGAPQELKKSEWQVVDETGEVKEQVVIKEDPNEFNQEETLLYNQECRLQLTNDLIELEFFLKQRIAELSSKDQTTYALYQAGEDRKQIVVQCDQLAFLQSVLKRVEEALQMLYNKETLQLILIRQKPK